MRIRRAGLNLLAALALLIMPALAAAESITIYSDEWCPHNCAPDSEKPGYMIEIAKAVFGKAGHTVTYKVKSWDESLEAAQKGSCDAIVGAVPTEAPGLVFPTEAQGASQMIFLAKADSKLAYAGVDSLADIKIGVIEDYVYDQGELDAYIAQNKDNPAKVRVTSGNNALDLCIGQLVKGEVDMIVADSAVVNYRLLVMGLADMVKEVGQDTLDPIFMAFSPKNPKAKEYAKMVSDGVKQLRASGELKKMLGSYGLKDWR
ncbi:MAG: transporter substrate-binding domain-containing protein [Thermodesulfobacteriota bacterium]